MGNQEKRFAQVRGQRMAYVERGSGEVVVFVHGNPTGSWTAPSSWPAGLRRSGARVGPLYERLAEYPEHFAADGSFSCEPVSELMGLLARSQGRQAESTSLLARGAAMAERICLTNQPPRPPAQL